MVTRPTRRELREAGYFYRAKRLVLRDINRERRGSRGQTRQGEEYFWDYPGRFGGR